MQPDVEVMHAVCDRHHQRIVRIYVRDLIIRMSLCICHYADLYWAKEISGCRPHLLGIIFNNWKAASSFTKLVSKMLII